MTSRKIPLPRVRRTPEEARRLILDAALRLFADHGPDAIGLKDVARAAGVSHALITHYFGTYDALVLTAFADHVRRMRSESIAQIAEIAADGPRAWIKHAAKQFADPVYGRLAAWALLTGRLEQADFFMRRDEGLRKVADAIEMRVAFEARGDKKGVAALSRDEIEFFMLLVMSSLIGYTLARTGLWGALGREKSATSDEWFFDRLANLVGEHWNEKKERRPPKTKTKTKPKRKRAAATR